MKSPERSTVTARPEINSCIPIPPSPVTWDWEAFVRARRLVEAGVPFVSMQVGLWDHHCAEGLPSLFESYRSLLTLRPLSFRAHQRSARPRPAPGRLCRGLGRVRAHT